MFSMLKSVNRVHQQWDEFWFTPCDAATLCVIRILLGFCLLWHYACGFSAADFIGPDAWVALNTSQTAGVLEIAGTGGRNSPSLWIWVTSETGVWWTYAFFLAAIVCLTIGVASRAACVMVLLGHLSFAHRCPPTVYGIDFILSVLLLYLIIAPVGAEFSVDRWISRCIRKQKPISEGRQLFWNANFSIRLIQIQMCIIYFCSGIAKLQGASWWDGTAIWYAIATPEVWIFDLNDLLVRHPFMVEIASLVGSVVTLVFEISFAFLIWKPAARPLILCTALVLHTGIGVLMGLSGFSAVMLTGCVAFISPEFIRSRQQRCFSMLSAEEVPVPGRA